MIDSEQKIPEIPVAIVGFGNVGRALLRRLKRLAGFRIVSVSNSEYRSVVPEGIDFLSIDRVIRSGDLRELSYAGHGTVDELQSCLFGVCPSCAPIVVDVTAADIGDLHLDWLESGFGVVTANKKPVTGSLDLWNQLIAHGSRYQFEAVCGAGLPVVSTVRRLVESNEIVHSIGAMPSGSLGYILSSYDGGNRSFGQIVRMAADAGYTEPDPRDDLSGMDVARKALVLARLCGMQLELSDIKPQSLVPASLDSCEADEFAESFFRDITSLGDVVSAEPTEGKVWRYLARIQPRSGITVGLDLVDDASPLGRLSGTENLFEISSSAFSDSGNLLKISGPGAGAEVTTVGILMDIGRVAGSMHGIHVTS